MKFRAVAPPESLSRVDTLPDAFAEMLRRKAVAGGMVIGGKYALHSFIADGAMGQVFTADNVAINMRVAVKLLRPELLASPDFRKRFQMEAEAIAAIVHPNVARFLDLVVGDPTFLVMEYVRGDTLAKILRQEPRLPVARAVALATRIAWGLDAAHSVGVIHRDLKPGNIMVAPDRECGETPKIIDFGLAKLASAIGGRQLTRTGQIVGTPEYMAPEQIQGTSVDGRSDVYSLGCVLYEMISGAPPFAEGGDVRVLYQQLHDVPPPLSARVGDIPPALEDVLARALAKRPEDRFASISDMTTALGRSIERRASGHSLVVDDKTENVRALPVVPTRPARRPRWRVGALATLGLATALAAGLAGGVGLERRGRTSPSPTSSPLANAGTGEQLFVLTSPQEATVVLDGQQLSETSPAAVRLAAGPHFVRLRKEGYQEVERRVVVPAGGRGVVEVALSAESRSVTVRTVPTGATLFVDDRLAAASTPATVHLTLDDFHTLRAERRGYETLEKHVTPEDRDPEVVLTMLEERQPRGHLFVDSSANAEVWIDGAYTGLRTPTLGIRVGVGEHTVELRDAGEAVGKPFRFDVKQGETVRLTLEPR